MILNIIVILVVVLVAMLSQDIMVDISITMEVVADNVIEIKNIKSVAYSSQTRHIGQLNFCNWLTDGSMTG